MSAAISGESERREELRRFLLAHGVPLREIPADTYAWTDGTRVFLERYLQHPEGGHLVDLGGRVVRKEFSVEAISPVLIPAWIPDRAD